ncbi:MAG: biotin--[acetyl-CoA-carboxylase] ligase [Bacteroidales bacterium]|nr:biotin--[acetyl-CoA-carboxylase] ligase [Bacteroidales bacterium]
MEKLSNERRIIRLEETDSTNRYLKQLVREERPEEGSLVIADYQTEGRGQMGNSWYSGRGDNLLFSLLIYPRQLPANESFILSRVTSLALKNLLDSFTDDIRIKWPNDIYWKDKKIAGILIENDIQGKEIDNTVIGIGLNVNQQIFPVDLANPVSLRQITGIQHNREHLLELFMREFFLLYRDLQEGLKMDIEDEYMLDLYRVNDYYWFEDCKGRFKAKIETVLSSGHLVLRTLDSDEERRYAFKEVSFMN